MPIQTPPPNAGIFGQGIKYPPEIDSAGRLKLSWGEQAVTEAMMSICATEPGERVMQPDYGAASTTFEPIELLQGRQKLEIERNLAEHEPRVESADVSIQPVTTQVSQIAFVSYRLVNEANDKTLTAPIFVGPTLTGPSE